MSRKKLTRPDLEVRLRQEAIRLRAAADDMEQAAEEIAEYRQWRSGHQTFLKEMEKLK